MKRKLAMVIINYNDYENAIKLVNNVKDYSCLDMILVVDNSSTDDSVKFLNKIKSKTIHILENKENKGYAYGLNSGARYVHEHHKDCDIIFSNTDIIIEKEKDLTDLASNLTKEYAVVGPTVVEGNHLNRGYRNSTITKEILYNLPLISRLFIQKTRYYLEEHYKGDISEVDFVSGCFFLVDGKVLKDIGYFDEQTFLYYEENILAKKLEEKSLKTIVNNYVVILHEHSVTIDKSVKRIEKQKILKASQRYFVKEYLNANKFQLFLLMITRNISILSLYIRGLMKK